jgi:hypothetical protein
MNKISCKFVSLMPVLLALMVKLAVAGQSLRSERNESSAQIQVPQGYISSGASITVGGGIGAFLVSLFSGVPMRRAVYFGAACCCVILAFYTVAFAYSVSVGIQENQHWLNYLHDRGYP